jgi:hypothetical protein
MSSSSVLKASVKSVREKTLVGLRSRNVANPVLQRLRQNMFDQEKTGLVITSYDRMHHRHNRG